MSTSDDEEPNTTSGAAANSSKAKAHDKNEASTSRGMVGSSKKRSLPPPRPDSSSSASTSATAGGEEEDPEEAVRLRDKNRTNSKRFRDRKKSYMDGLFEEKYRLGKQNNDLQEENGKLRRLLEEALVENELHKRKSALGLYCHHNSNNVSLAISTGSSRLERILPYFNPAAPASTTTLSSWSSLPASPAAHQLPISSSMGLGRSLGIPSSMSSAQLLEQDLLVLLSSPSRRAMMLAAAARGAEEQQREIAAAAACLKLADSNKKHKQDDHQKNKNNKDFLKTAGSTLSAMFGGRGGLGDGGAPGGVSSSIHYS